MDLKRYEDIKSYVLHKNYPSERKSKGDKANLGQHQLATLALFLDDRYLSGEDCRFVELVHGDLEDFLSGGQRDDIVLLFPPVNNYLRLLIHKTVEDYQDLHSFSIGEGTSRQTVVCWHTALTRSGASPDMCSYRPPALRGRGRARFKNEDSLDPGREQNLTQREGIVNQNSWRQNRYDGHSDPANTSTVGRGPPTTTPLRGPPTTTPLRGSPTTTPLRGPPPTTPLRGPPTTTPQRVSPDDTTRQDRYSQSQRSVRSEVTRSPVVTDRSPTMTDESPNQSSDIPNQTPPDRWRNRRPDVQMYVPRGRRQQTNVSTASSSDRPARLSPAARSNRAALARRKGTSQRDVDQSSRPVVTVGNPDDSRSLDTPAAAADATSKLFDPADTSHELCSQTDINAGGHGDQTETSRRQISHSHIHKKMKVHEDHYIGDHADDTETVHSPDIVSGHREQICTETFSDISQNQSQDSSGEHGNLSQDMENIDRSQDMENIDRSQDMENIDRSQDMENIDRSQDMEDIDRSQGMEDIDRSQDMENIDRSQDMENIDRSQDMENIDRSQDMENIDRSQDMENIDRSQDMEDIDRSQGMEDIDRSQDMENIDRSQDMENIDRSQDMENIDRSQDMENIDRSQDMENIDRSQDMEDIDRSQGMEDIDRSQDMENIDRSQDMENIDRSQDMENIDRSQDMENIDRSQDMEDIDRSQGMEDIDRSQDMENIDRSQDMENIDRSQDMEDIDRSQGMENIDRSKDMENNGEPLTEVDNGWNNVKSKRTEVEVSRNVSVSCAVNAGDDDKCTDAGMETLPVENRSQSQSENVECEIQPCDKVELCLVDKGGDVDESIVDNDEEILPCSGEVIADDSEKSVNINVEMEEDSGETKVSELIKVIDTQIDTQTEVQQSEDKEFGEFSSEDQQQSSTGIGQQDSTTSDVVNTTSDATITNDDIRDNEYERTRETDDNVDDAHENVCVAEADILEKSVAVNEDNSRVDNVPAPEQITDTIEAAKSYTESVCMAETDVQERTDQSVTDWEDDVRIDDLPLLDDRRDSLEAVKPHTGSDTTQSEREQTLKVSVTDAEHDSGARTVGDDVEMELKSFELFNEIQPETRKADMIDQSGTLGNDAKDIHQSDEGSSDEDTWDAMFDDDGECLDPSTMDELTKTVGKVKIQKSKKINYLDYQPKDKAELDYDAYGHIIEIYDFPAEFLTRDLISAFQSFMSRGFDLKWVDDTHALGVFASQVAAQDALSMTHPLLKVCPLSQASRQSKAKARTCTEFLKPYKARPQTTAISARRLVAGALGLATNIPKEKRDKERQQLKEAREKRRNDRRNRVDMWEFGGKCAMDEET